MDFLDESLESIHGLSIHWSSDCNMACKYCYIDKDKDAMFNFNKEIQESLKNGSFLKNIKEVFKNRTEQIESLALWGAEPTLNGLYFKDFAYELFDFFPNANSMMFSTNALIGADWIYDKFFVPLYEYAEERQREIRFELQLSLDGPPEFNDDSRHPGATESTLNTLRTILKKAPNESRFFSFRVFPKATLDISYMREMIDGGVEKFNWYYKFFNDLQEEALKLIEGKQYIYVNMATLPTLVDPGFYTVDDGKKLAEWIKYLSRVDRTQLPHYNHTPLFVQPISGVETYLENLCNPIVEEFNAYSCSAGKNNVTIDYNGNLYTCNRLCRNAAMDEKIQNKHSMKAGSNLHLTDKQWIKSIWGSQALHNDIMSRRYIFDELALLMAKAGQIDEKYAYSADDRTLLFFVMTSIYCHVGNEEEFTGNQSLPPASLFRIFGNGAIDEMIKYMNTEIHRGEIKPWKIVM